MNTQGIEYVSSEFARFADSIPPRSRMEARVSVSFGTDEIAFEYDGTLERKFSVVTITKDGGSVRNFGAKTKSDFLREISERAKSSVFSDGIES